MVAVLQADGKAPAFLAAVDLSRGLIAIRRYGAEPVSGRSYELWAVGGGRSAPQSLGVIDASLQIPADRLGRLDLPSLGTRRLRSASNLSAARPPGPRRGRSCTRVDYYPFRADPVAADQKKGGSLARSAETATAQSVTRFPMKRGTKHRIPVDKSHTVSWR